jgi:exopolyphosphatase/guanosine-5'-triphosphate,3'-diphosphate pyrophosphatase
MTTPLAALDIGANTIRLLVARPAGSGMDRLVDQTITARLGQGVDASGRLAPERMQRAVEAVIELVQRAQTAGVSEILAVATSAVRDAANGHEFIALVGQRTGIDVTVIDGDREADLTFRGALLGRPLAGRQLVADIGGGSTELIVAHDAMIAWAGSLQLGSGRLTERCLPSDPPSPSEIEGARAIAAAILDVAPQQPIEQAVVVGGTASALLLLRGEAGGDQLTRAGLTTLLNHLLAAPAAVIATDGLVDVERARVLPGGAVIIDMLMQRFALDAVTVSQGGIREGLLLERWVVRGE